MASSQTEEINMLRQELKELKDSNATLRGSNTRLRNQNEHMRDRVALVNRQLNRTAKLLRSFIVRLKE